MRDLIVRDAVLPSRATVIPAVLAAVCFLPGVAVIIGVGFGIAAAMVASAFRTPEAEAR